MAILVLFLVAAVACYISPSNLCFPKTHFQRGYFPTVSWKRGLECKNNMEYGWLTCWKPCPSGYLRYGPSCFRECPAFLPYFCSGNFGCTTSRQVCITGNFYKVTTCQKLVLKAVSEAQLLIKNTPQPLIDAMAANSSSASNSNTTATANNSTTNELLSTNTNSSAKSNCISSQKTITLKSDNANSTITNSEFQTSDLCESNKTEGGFKNPVVENLVNGLKNLTA